MSARVAVAGETREEREEREERLCDLAYQRMIGLADAIERACYELVKNVPEFEDVTPEHLKKLGEVLRAALPALVGTGTGDAFHLTERVLKIEEPGVLFADRVAQLADHYGCWARGKGFADHYGCWARGKGFAE